MQREQAHHLLKKILDLQEQKAGKEKLASKMDVIIRDVTYEVSSNSPTLYNVTISKTKQKKHKAI